MRRIAIAGQGQGSRTSAPLQAEALAYFARMTVPPSAAFRDAVNWAIWRWKAIGAWSQIRGLWILSADTAQAGLLSVIGDTPRDAVTVGTSPTFTALKGFSGFTETRQVRFPISSDSNGVAFLAAKVSEKSYVDEETNTVYVSGTFIKSDAGAGLNVMGNFSLSRISPWPLGVRGAGHPYIVAGSAVTCVGGSRANISFAGGSQSGFMNGAGAASSSSNFITTDMAYHPLDRLSAYGFLQGSVSDNTARKFISILAALLEQLGALD